MRHRRGRLDAILRTVAHGPADVEELAKRFGVSPSTIRRDLQELSGRQAVARTYGGAMLLPPECEASFDVRTARNRAAKAAIAEAASAEIRDGETLILDGGSTVATLGRRLRGRRLRVITNNLQLIPVLADAPGMELVVLGGAVRPISMGTIGPLAEQTLRHMTADKVFTSADGAVPGRGLCEATLEQVSLKELMLRQAAEAFVLADADKLGRAGQPCWVPFQPGWTLITDAEEAACAPFRADGMRVIRAPLRPRHDAVPGWEGGGGPPPPEAAPRRATREARPVRARRA